MKKWGKSGFEEHVAEVQNFYKNQRDKMIKAADIHLTGLGIHTRLMYTQLYSSTTDIRYRGYYFSRVGFAKGRNVPLDEIKRNF